MRVTDEVVGRFKAMWDEGYTVTAIAARHKYCRKTVSTWLNGGTLPSERQREIAARRRAVAALARRSRKEVRTRYTVKRRLKRTSVVTVRPFASARAVAREITRRKGEVVSERTVRRDLRAVGMKPFSQPKGPHLTDAHRAYRREFAKRMLRFSKAKRMKILFSDEKYFDTRTHRFMTYWDYQARDLPSGGYVQGGPKLMVLGFIGRSVKKLILCTDKTMTTDVYRAHLRTMLPTLRCHWFQQDNASPHAALLRSQWFSRNGIETMRWPAHSPDLNVIETVWAIVGARVAKAAPTGEDEIREFVLREWEALPQETITKLCEEFDDRLRVCMAADGHLVTRTKLREWRREQKAGKKAGK